MDQALNWRRDGHDWPNAHASRFVYAAGIKWHVQVSGRGPVLLLLHGTGASTHSWRDLLPLLSTHFTVVAPDLPGHGFTGMPALADGMSLPGMAAGIGQLCRQLSLLPAFGVGHSAGAAILARQALDRTLALQGLISVNGALLPFPGVPGQLFGPLARMMSAGSLVPRLFAWQVRTDRQLIARMIAGTGSQIDRQGVDLYRRLAGNPHHVRAALAMMSNWDLQTLDRQLDTLAVPVLVLSGERDRAVPPVKAQRMVAMLPASRLILLDGLGHLAHEEAPARVAALVVNELLGAGNANA
jgi:magnesium chelatase accessory protein